MDVATPEDTDIAEEIAHQALDEVRRRKLSITATYRLQLHRDFNFHDAAAIVPYLKDLGVSHVYCSPYLRAQLGSKHGYDICDHSHFNPELGGLAGFTAFTEALKRHGLGHILDIVPNHMAASLENPWWFDVLENGPVSAYSRYFDIDWRPVKHELANKILLPVLGQHYGEALEDGQLQLAYHAGAFFVRYHERDFPLGPKTAIPLLSNRLDELRGACGEAADVTELESIITALDHLPPQTARDPAAIRERQRQWRQAMLATSTHDTKRSEDVRARLNALSEVPRSWRAALARFARANKRLIREIDGEAAPGRNDEYLFYQSLIGIWPLKSPHDDERQRLIERLAGYMEKATREAKQRTSWSNPNEEYDAAIREFVAQSLRDSPRNAFLKNVEELLAEIEPIGHYNALSQVALKLLSPGTPDIFQGQELWDFSLVDPDNRRPVDYALRRKLLAELHAWHELNDEDRRAKVTALGRAWADPRLKLLVTTRLLQLRRNYADVFAAGEYLPLETIGSQSENLVSFGFRPHAGSPLALIAIVPRQIAALRSAGNPESLWVESAWRDTTISLPADSDGEYRHWFTKRSIAPANGGWTAAHLLDELPLAVLIKK